MNKKERMAYPPQECVEDNGPKETGLKSIGEGGVNPYVELSMFDKFRVR